MTGRKIDWPLSPTERELLRRDCEASKVPIAVEDPDAIKRIVGLITKSGGDHRDAAEKDLGPPRQAERAPPENDTPPQVAMAIQRTIATTTPLVTGKLVNFQLPHRGQYSVAVDTVKPRGSGESEHEGLSLSTATA